METEVVSTVAVKHFCGCVVGVWTGRLDVLSVNRARKVVSWTHVGTSIGERIAWLWLSMIETPSTACNLARIWVAFCANSWLGFKLAGVFGCRKRKSNDMDFLVDSWGIAG